MIYDVHKLLLSPDMCPGQQGMEVTQTPGLLGQAMTGWGELVVL